MTCNEFRDHLLDMATANEGPADARVHASECAGCAAELASFQKNMAMQDDWAAPADTSPYFMTRLNARLREEAEQPARGWMQWFRRPGLALAMMFLMVLSVSLYRGGTRENDTKHTDISAKLAKPGTAVGDLQNLDKNHDMLADFELLDDLEQTN